MIKAMLIAGVGGFIGTCGRFLIQKWASMLFHGLFPIGTFFVNIVGCFIIGLCVGFFERNNMVNSNESLLLVTGFCGGFTTFSTFANDVWSLGNKGEISVSLLYLLASIVCGLLFVWGGRTLVK